MILLLGTSLGVRVTLTGLWVERSWRDTKLGQPDQEIKDNNLFGEVFTLKVAFILH
jgi:hypothetical protein